MVEIPTICRYCGGAVHLVPAAKVYGPAAAKRLGLEREKFYQCQNCNARVGCHKGSARPLGNLANEALRMKRMETHQVFDSFWKERGMSRTQGYKWMAKKLRLSEELAHIGGFEMDRCQKLIRLCEKERNKEKKKETAQMCERTYCRHEHERLCSCPPVTCRDALGMAAHLAENMEQVQWSLTYNSLKEIKPYQLCLVGKCRICGGRLCMEQRPVEADSTDGFLAAVYRHLYHFHRSIGQCLPRAAFRTKFVEMFRKEDRAAIEDWLALPENSHVERMYRRSVKGAYTIVHSWADADQGEFPSPSGVATFTDREKARAELNRLVTEEKENMEIPFSKELYREEYGNDFWEAYRDGYAAGWFTRYEIIESPLFMDKEGD